MAYEPLPMVEVAVDDVRLDLDNYRIPTKPEDEAAALLYLFDSEDVMDAAQSILRNGYFDNEVPIVIEAPDGSYVVLEGNRRVSALKALRDPGLAPGHEAKVRQLLKRFTAEAEDLPERIRVLVAPDRETAAPHIARLHTGLSKRRWSRDQQATFYYSLLDEHTTVEDVKAQYPEVPLARFFKMAVMRRFLSGVRFDDQKLYDYAVSNKLAMSSFEYAYNKPQIAAAMGVRFTKDGLLEPVSMKPEDIGAGLPEGQRRVVEYLLAEFKEKRLNTRSPALKTRDAAHERLVETLHNVAAGHKVAAGSYLARPATPPPAAPRAAPSASSVLPPAGASIGSGPVADTSGGAPQPATAASGSAGSRGPNSSVTKDKLDLSGLDYSQAPVNLKDRYIELRKLSLKEVPTTTAILLRSILETTVKYYLDVKKLPSDGALKLVLKGLGKAEGNNKALMTSFRPIDSGNAETPGSVAWFNTVAHSADKPVGKEAVHEAWKLVEPLLRRLLP